MQNINYSIIIPHYNDIHRLARLIDTIPRSRGDIETIVVDDASPDQDAVDQFERYYYPSVKLIRTEKNKGAGAARNIGLEKASGKYILFADADDTYLENSFKVIDNVVCESCDLIYFLADAVIESTLEPSIRADIFNKLCLDYLEGRISQEQLKIGHVIPVAKVYSKKFLNSIDTKFEEVSVGNDVFFNVVAALKAKCIKVCDQKIYRIYRSSKSLTSITTPEQFIERVRVTARVASAMKELGVKEKRSASGWLLESIGYGWRIFWKTLAIVLNSEMSLNLHRIFNPKQFVKFFRLKAKISNEIKSGYNNF